MKCDYCGKKSRTCISRGYSVPRIIEQDYLGNQLCNSCRGSYKVLRLQDMVRKGNTLKEAKHRLSMENYLLWTGIRRTT